MFIFQLNQYTVMILIPQLQRFSEKQSAEIIKYPTLCSVCVRFVFATAGNKPNAHNGREDTTKNQNTPSSPPRPEILF
jgi:hypothetical protein